MDLLWEDSNILKVMFHNKCPSKEEVLLYFSLIKSLDDVILFYNNNFKNFKNNRLIVLLEYLNLLDCSRIIDILIVLKYNYRMYDYFYIGIKLDKYLKIKYDKIELKENILTTAIYYKAYILAKQYVNLSDNYSELNSLIAKDDVDEFSILIPIFIENGIISHKLENYIIESVNNCNSCNILTYMLNSKYHFSITIDNIQHIILEGNCLILKVILNYFFNSDRDDVLGPELINFAIMSFHIEIVKIILDYDMIAVYPNNNKNTLDKVLFYLNKLKCKLYDKKFFIFLDDLEIVESMIRLISNHRYYKSSKCRHINFSCEAML